MTTKQFIEKAIKGGYNPVGFTPFCFSGQDLEEFGECIYFSEILEDDVKRKANTYGIALAVLVLEPDLWQAVGKVEGWEETVCRKPEVCSSRGKCGRQDWKKNMHAMIDALIDGKGVEEFLETL